MECEKWVPICGFDGIYEVSNFGRVRSVDRLDTVGRRIKGKTLRLEIRESENVKLARVLLVNGKMRRKELVSRLVWEAFIEKIDWDAHKAIVCPKDGNWENMHVTNLHIRTEAHGITPYGFVRDDVGNLVANDYEQKICKLIFDLRKQRYPFELISLKLNSMGLITRDHKLWDRRRVSHIYKTKHKEEVAQQ